MKCNYRLTITSVELEKKYGINKAGKKNEIITMSACVCEKAVVWKPYYVALRCVGVCASPCFLFALKIFYFTRKWSATIEMDGGSIWALGRVGQILKVWKIIEIEYVYSKLSRLDNDNMTKGGRMRKKFDIAAVTWSKQQTIPFQRE